MKKNLISIVLTVCLLFSLANCTTATPAKTHMPLSQVPDPQMLSQITTSFETSDKINIGFLGVLSIITVSVGCYMMANPGPGYEKEALTIGAITSGAGLGMALIQGFGINSAKAQRINTAARESLLTAAKQRYPEEDIDVRNVSVEYVQRSGQNHLYNASGIIIKKY